jgi:F420-dependent oxidoreductase-like protein
VDEAVGRALHLGLGASGPQVIEGFHGVPYDRPLGRTREIIDICHSIWRRDRLVHDGASYHVPLPEDEGTGLGKALKIMDHPVRERIPIYVASLGPRNVEMTAEVAEGWLPLYFWPERAGDQWGDALAAGRARRSADLPALEVVAGGPLAIGDGLEHLRERIRPTLALYFGGMGAGAATSTTTCCAATASSGRPARSKDLYLSGRKEEAAALVPQELVDGLSLVGDAAYVKDRVEAFRAAGVTILNVAPAGPNGAADVETVASWLT